MRSVGDVASYYDRNTPRFLLVGGGGASHTIHRLLWGPDVSTVQEAASYIHRLVEEEIRTLQLGEPFRLVDMGCGVGGTVLELARCFPQSHFVGITISSRQHALAFRLAEQERLEGRCRFLCADFEAIGLEEPAHLMLAIESFVHSVDPSRFFHAVAGNLRPEGHLIIVDDFLEESEEKLAPRAQRCVDQFRSGWRVPGVSTVPACLEAARAEGLQLVRNADLSTLIRLGRPRDLLVAGVAPIAQRLGLGRLSFFGSLIGGAALHAGLAEGFIRYRILTLRKARAQS
jgi:tocopherol O-methyltransferase